MSTSFTTSYDEKTVSGFLEGMKERECYTRVLHLDC
jgi:alpha-glucosidase (family GH31 glycosyl hydrolase)